LPASLLPSRTWETSYRHGDGDLISLFYVPVLSCAVQYDRTTGYFSATALTLAARGIEKLIANGGRMRLLIGCTLPDEEEERAIEQGYDLRRQVAEHLAIFSIALRRQGSRGAAPGLTTRHDPRAAEDANLRLRAIETVGHVLGLRWIANVTPARKTCLFYGLRPLLCVRSKRHCSAVSPGSPESRQ
jgi:hypothetical protein